MEGESLTLMKNVLQTLAIKVLILLGLTAAASAVDAGIHIQEYMSWYVVRYSRYKFIRKYASGWRSK